jgi:hypothetical protein
VSVAALVAPACSGSGNRGSPTVDSPSSTPPTPTASDADTDIRLLTNAIAAEEELLNFCTAASRRYPAKRSLLTDVIAFQHQHVRRFRGSLTNLEPPVTRTSRPLPHRSGELPSELAAAERAAADHRSADCLAATSGLLAELFGSVAASHAVTAQALVPGPIGNPVSPSGPLAGVGALEPCLLAEYAAVFGYGVLGGVLSAGVSDRPAASAAVSSYDVHRDRRDALVALITAAGVQPPAAAAAYDIPFPVTGLPSARRLARYIEGRCAAVYVRAIGSTTGQARRLVSSTLVDCAVRGVSWGAAPEAFPGLGSE